jgi:S1-C subfamily serine protease
LKVQVAMRRAIAAVLFTLLAAALARPARAQAVAQAPPAPSVAASSASPGDSPSPAVPTSAPVPNTDGPQAHESLKVVYGQVADSIVLIDTEYGTGSGFFFHDSHLVATALHVVDDADHIIVQANDGQRTTGRVVAYSREHDVALVELKTPFQGVRVLEPHRGFIDIGEKVLVVGHPFSGLENQVKELRGLLNWSLTQGVVSAVSASWIQTDAAINPGNSGGPVMDAHGQVLGVVSAKLSDAQGISVAARVERLEALLPKIGTQPPPRHDWAFDGVELGLVVQASHDVIEGFSLGAGARLLKRFPMRLRIELLAGDVEPDAATIVSTHLVRAATELTFGYALPAGPVEFAPYLGGALFYDHERDSSLRIDDLTCAAPPCLVNGKVLRSSQGQFSFLPLAGLSLDFNLLRVSYAYELALKGSVDSQHRVLIAVIF